MTVFGPPPWSGVTTHSARPSPLRSPAATNAPPVKSPPNGSVAGTSTVVPSRPSITAKRTGVPGPVASTRSGVPSAFTSALVERTFAGTVPNGLRVRPGLVPNRPPAGRYATAVPFPGPPASSGAAATMVTDAGPTDGDGWPAPSVAAPAGSATVTVPGEVTPPTRIV